MGNWLERLAGDHEGNSDEAGRYIGRSELIRYETSTERVYEARRFRTHDRGGAGAPLVLTACHRDRDLLRPALNFLANQGVSVYVDFKEGGLPDGGSPEYVEWLRSCLERDERLVLVSTQEGIVSPWTSWQLGVAEGMLGADHVAVLPVETYGYFRGSTLMDLYPAIMRREGTWSLSAPGGPPGPTLRDWLS